MAQKKPKRYFVKVNSKGEGVLLQGQPNHTIARAGKVYEVSRSLFINLMNRGGAEEIEQAEALKMVEDVTSNVETKALEDHTIPELGVIADEEGVDISEVTKKADIIAAIRGAANDDDE